MSLNAFAYTADQVRAAEEPLLATQREPDQLMRSAAHAVALAAGTLLPHNHNHNHAHPRVLVLAGSGGNGGDALYAMAELLESTPLNVEVILTSRSGKVHELALTTCKNTGATVVDEPSGTYDLVIDGILGLGGAGGLREDAARLVRAVDKRAVLSVDVPSGIGADDPTTPPPLADGTPTHVSADVTVTFGGYRLAHGLSEHCGEVLLADPHTHAGSISEHLPKSHITLSRAATPSRDYPAELRTLAFPELPDLTPRAEDDKYSGGVVGICAGSQTYPGAAVLATTGAVRTTSSMVRYAGPQALEVVRALPEVVATTTVAEAGRVQSWVFGPGSGTEDTNTLADILATDLPVLIDADGLTLLTHHEPLREQVAQRTAPTVLTPHLGEYDRLAEALGLEAAELNHAEKARRLAQELDCTVLLKGRFTAIADEEDVRIVDTASSWAATPGSGDVMAGMAGAVMALVTARKGAEYATEPLAAAVALHALAARISARMPEGYAPTSASRIAEAIPRASAQLSR